MRVDVLARRWGGPDGGPDGMAVAASYLARTLCALGHEVRAYAGALPPWQADRMTWLREIPQLHLPPDWDADLVLTTMAPAWHRTMTAAIARGVSPRLVYWHHHGEPPTSGGLATLAAPPATVPPADWSRSVVLPPSSWAVDAGGSGVHQRGDAVLVPGAGVAKGGHVARRVADLVSGVPWLVLRGRCSTDDMVAWRGVPDSEVATGLLPQSVFLGRARVVLAPTRFEVHPLCLVEAAVRGIPVVCSDLPGTRAALGASAIYVSVQAPDVEWAAALRRALAAPLPRLRLAPYADTVSAALRELHDSGIVRAA